MYHRPQTVTSARHPWLDFAIAVMVLAVVTWQASPADWHWPHVSPNPWLLLPVLMGVRWGFAWGLGSGMAAAIFCAAVPFFRGQEISDLWKQREWFWLSFPLFGIITGEVATLMTSRATRSAAEAEMLRREVEALTIERDTLAETWQSLHHRLAVLGADDLGLDEKLARLLLRSGTDRLDGALRLLRDVCGVRSAAVYRQNGDAWRVQASLGAEVQEQLELGRWPGAALAVEKQELVTVRDLLGGGRVVPDGEFIAAHPWGKDGALVITGMKFSSITERSFARLKTIVSALDHE